MNSFPHKAHFHLLFLHLLSKGTFTKSVNVPYLLLLMWRFAKCKSNSLGVSLGCYENAYWVGFGDFHLELKVTVSLPEF